MSKIKNVVKQTDDVISGWFNLYHYKTNK